MTVPTWRPMRPDDLPAVVALADRIHVAHPEQPAVFAERLTLHAEGCFVLAAPAGVAGYAVSHPWTFGAPPALDTLLGALPERSDTYYIHDVALDPAMRGTGAAAAIVARIVAHARTLALPHVSLVAVNGTAPFWRRHGFAPCDAPDLAAKLTTYGDDAVLMLRPLPSTDAH